MKSESIKEITTALAKAQVAFKPIKRTEKVGYDTKSGSKKYNYAPLSEVIEATKQALSDNGLAITQTTCIRDGNTILETLLSHSSGEWVSGELYVGKQEQAPQSEGSALTYKRRYGMSAILCVASEEDDDGKGVDKIDEGEIQLTITKEDIRATPPTPQQLYDTAVTQKNGAALCSYAMKNGYTIEKIKATLGIVKSSDIKDVKAAAVVLFPKPANTLMEEAVKLGATIRKEDR